MDIDVDLTLDIKRNENVADVTVNFEVGGYLLDSCQLFSIEKLVIDEIEMHRTVGTDKVSRSMRPKFRELRDILVALASEIDAVI